MVSVSGKLVIMGGGQYWSNAAHTYLSNILVSVIIVLGQYVTANASYYTDGIHYTAAGYQEIANLVAPAIQQVYANKKV